jgi:aspartokinase/homoserine dehydrogenase 1
LQADVLRDEFGVDLRILAIATSGRMLLKEKGINLEHWREEFQVR